jgi:hypothetical protein
MYQAQRLVFAGCASRLLAVVAAEEMQTAPGERAAAVAHVQAF